MHFRFLEVLRFQVLTVRSILADEEVRQGLKAWVSRMILLPGDEADIKVVRLADVPTAVSQRGAGGRSRHCKCNRSFNIMPTEIN